MCAIIILVAFQRAAGTLQCLRAVVQLRVEHLSFQPQFEGLPGPFDFVLRIQSAAPDIDAAAPAVRGLPALSKRHKAIAGLPDRVEIE